MITEHRLSCGVGFGERVDDATMAVYLKRFGVSQAQIDALPLKLPKPSKAPVNPPNDPSIPACVKKSDQMDHDQAPSGHDVCAVCRKKSSSSCSKCHAASYCSKECQRTDWKVHKMFCSLGPWPKAPKGEEQSVQAFLFPAQGTTPALVRVTIEKIWDDDEGLSTTLSRIYFFGTIFF